MARDFEYNTSHEEYGFVQCATCGLYRYRGCLFYPPSSHPYFSGGALITEEE